MDGGPANLTIDRIVEWADTDASGHYHYVAALRFFDDVESALIERLGLLEMFGRLPRVHVSVDYRQTLWFRDRVQVHVAVDHVGTASIRYRFVLTHQGETCASAEVVAVLLDTNAGRPQPWSDEHRHLLTTAGSLAAAPLA